MGIKNIFGLSVVLELKVENWTLFKEFKVIKKNDNYKSCSPFVIFFNEKN